MNLVLDLQAMETGEELGHGGGYDAGSNASLLLCGDSSLSVTTCD
ncbi:hypothetical protein GCM10012275_37230 [Longimycelium tulufanense]|uniref:SapB/AmfS family lantipeptide n=1 Tax=Longimycelium tulufanense TaxID=907463 RepID=A0A8J3CGM2_9PSEU|nr:SapB/AmfS family lanthipeptide [Longimycelium tulufanense]GGM63149.1 hypothetical protein GCM10012275_37230 [Longimycelium tulufanense]